MRAVWRSALAAVFGCALIAAAEPHPVLPIGSQAPDFALPGVDGKIHRLSDYAASPILVIVFTCNHCPIAQMYESRIQQLSDDYRDRGVAVVAIEGNAPNAIRVDELDSSDMSDTLREMKIRVAWKHLRYPYLYDGDTQSVTRAFGPQATPHVFIFDRERRLRYEGRVDNSYRTELVRTRDARNAIDALLAGHPVAVTHTGVFGCSTKWKEKETSRIAALQKIESQPVTLESSSAAEVAKLLANSAGKLMLLHFWTTSDTAQLADLETTYRMYSDRDLLFITVCTDDGYKRAGAQRILEEQHATSRNLFVSDHPVRPATLLIAPGGEVLYGQNGETDVLQLRRRILAALPSDYIGFNRYWTTQEPAPEQE